MLKLIHGTKDGSWAGNSSRNGRNSINLCLSTLKILNRDKNEKYLFLEDVNCVFKEITHVPFQYVLKSRTFWASKDIFQLSGTSCCLLDGFDKNKLLDGIMTDPTQLM